MSKGKDEAFEKAYASVVENGWTNVKHMARQVWDMASATPPAAQVQEYFPSDLLASSVMNADEVDPANFAAQVQGEREAFEAWVRRERPGSPLQYVRDALPVDHPRYGEYCDDTLQCAWEGWQARAALSAPPAADMTDAYVGARQDVAIWKRRALEAEEKVRVLDQRIDQLVLDAQGETRMGEPHIAPSAAGVLEQMSEEARSTLVGMVEFCLERRYRMGMDEGFASFDPEVEHDFVKELRAFVEGAPTPPASEQQQAVVLPEWKQFPDPAGFATMPEWYARQHIEASTHNACLDELLRLNPHLAGVNQGVTTEAGNGGEA